MDPGGDPAQQEDAWRNWAGLPAPLLERVARSRRMDAAAVVAMARTCRPWRAAARRARPGYVDRTVREVWGDFKPRLGVLIQQLQASLAQKQQEEAEAAAAEAAAAPPAAPAAAATDPEAPGP